MAKRTLNTTIQALVVACTAISVAGCGGIEFESKLLDNIGVNTGGLFGDRKHKNQPLETRSALVVPPSVEALPAPGSSQVATSLDPSFPKNPESVAAAQKKAAEAKLKKECDPENGEFGSRQSGNHSDIETRAAKHNPNCSSVLKDTLGNAL